MIAKIQKAELGYWMEGLESPAFRGRVIRELMDLMDQEYQERVMFSDNSRDDNYQWEFQNAFELLCEDAFGDNINIEVPYDDIGRVLKTEREAELIHQVCKVFEPLYLDSNNDKEFLESPKLEEMRKLSKEAFIEFMKGEEQNEKFCVFVVGCIEEESRNYKIDTNKTDYQNIIAFAKSR